MLMPLLQKAFLPFLAGLLLLAAPCTWGEIGEKSKGGPVSNGSLLDFRPALQGNPKPTERQQVGDSNAAEPLFPRGLRITPPPPKAPPPPPRPETPPPPISKPDRGVMNPRTGDYYPPVPGGVIIPQSGEVLPKVNGGYINPKTGEFFPEGK